MFRAPSQRMEQITGQLPSPIQPQPVAQPPTEDYLSRIRAQNQARQDRINSGELVRDPNQRDQGPPRYVTKEKAISLGWTPPSEPTGPIQTLAGPAKNLSTPLPGGGSFPPQRNFQVPMLHPSPGIVPPHLSMGRMDIRPGGGFNPHQQPMFPRPPMGNRFGGGMGGGRGGGGGMQQFMHFMQTMMQMFQQIQGGGGMGGRQSGGYGGGFQNQMRKPYRDISSPYGGY